ncbi:MAG: nitroreductase [Euryarchaeota archaeon]|nr:nitroreductase [Euryarchaeota archaeon]
MDESELYDAIFRRRSVRKYAGPLDHDALTEICQFTASLRPLFPDIKIGWKLLGGDGVKGLFKVDAPHFLTIYSEPKKGYLFNAGFMMQQMDLFLSTKEVGSCWQGGPRPVRKGGASGLKFTISMAFGKPSGEVHRNDLSEFKRRPLSEITNVTGMDNVLEPARLAPSAMNNQSWYFTGSNDEINVYWARSAMNGRMNQINAGIALCHLWLAAAHEGGYGKIVRDPPKEGAPRKGYEYAATVLMK